MIVVDSLYFKLVFVLISFVYFLLFYIVSCSSLWMFFFNNKKYKFKIFNFLIFIIFVFLLMAFGRDENILNYWDLIETKYENIYITSNKDILLKQSDIVVLFEDKNKDWFYNIMKYDINWDDKVDFYYYYDSKNKHFYEKVFPFNKCKKNMLYLFFIFILLILIYKYSDKKVSWKSKIASFFIILLFLQFSITNVFALTEKEECYSMARKYNVSSSRFTELNCMQYFSKEEINKYLNSFNSINENDYKTWSEKKDLSNNVNMGNKCFLLWDWDTKIVDCNSNKDNTKKILTWEELENFAVNNLSNSDKNINLKTWDLTWKKIETGEDLMLFNFDNKKNKDEDSLIIHNLQDKWFLEGDFEEKSQHDLFLKNKEQLKKIFNNEKWSDETYYLWMIWNVRKKNNIDAIEWTLDSFDDWIKTFYHTNRFSENTLEILNEWFDIKVDWNITKKIEKTIDKIDKLKPDFENISKNIGKVFLQNKKNGFIWKCKNILNKWSKIVWKTKITRKISTSLNWISKFWTAIWIYSDYREYEKTFNWNRKKALEATTIQWIIDKTLWNNPIDLVVDLSSSALYLLWQKKLSNTVWNFSVSSIAKDTIKNAYKDDYDTTMFEVNDIIKDQWKWVKNEKTLWWKIKKWFTASVTTAYWLTVFGVRTWIESSKYFWKKIWNWLKWIYNFTKNVFSN